ncbi:hypothetical protein ABZP36_021498 [Zizania latifolia]
MNKLMPDTLLANVTSSSVAALDKVEAAQAKFNDAPFFLGQFSLVDIAYVPFIERFHIFFSDIKTYDITEGQPNLEKFIETHAFDRRGKAATSPIAKIPGQLGNISEKIKCNGKYGKDIPVSATRKILIAFSLFSAYAASDDDILAGTGMRSDAGANDDRSYKRSRDAMVAKPPQPDRHL